jgi:hypothetical protein
LFRWRPLEKTISLNRLDMWFGWHRVFRSAIDKVHRYKRLPRYDIIATVFEETNGVVNSSKQA